MSRSLLLTCAALALGVLVPGHASAEVTHHRVQGASAAATLYLSSECLETYSDLYVQELKGSEEASLTVFVHETDYCEGAQSDLFYASALIPAGAFRTTGHLSHSTLRLTVQGSGPNGAPESAVLDLTWTGTGSIESVVSNGWSRWGASTFRVRFSGLQRNATLSGRLMLGSRNLAAATDDAYGNIDLIREGYTTIERP